jgi:hypothetical protein
MSGKPALRIPDWVPDAARRQITDLWAQSWLDDAEREMLDRLATSGAMKTEVWEKLPSEPRGFEGNIIYRAFFAFRMFRALRRPFPKKKSAQVEWAKHLKHLKREPAAATWHAVWLWEDMLELKYETDLSWDRLWEGDKSITADQVLTILSQIRRFYERMHEEHHSFLASLPKVNRWNANAAQKFFTEYLSARMRETYAQPLDSIVAALAEVAFDLRQGISAETVRGRRRIGETPENSKQKSR